jgi:hypothetical protein
MGIINEMARMVMRGNQKPMMRGAPYFLSPNSGDYLEILNISECIFHGALVVRLMPQLHDVFVDSLHDCVDVDPHESFNGAALGLPI